MADKQPARSMEEIEADITATRSRLARSIDELAYRVNPETLKANAVNRLQTKAQEVTARAQSKVVDDDGEPRYDNVAKGLGAVAGVTLTLGVLRRIFNKS